MSATSKWRRFENLVAELQRALARDAVVTQNERIRGKTGALRETDITIRQKVAQFDILIVVECKDYKSPVDVKNVETFAGLLEDVGANKGAMVAANGFTSTAKTLATMKGIDLFRLLDTQSVEWTSYVSVPALVRNLRLKWRAVFEGAREEIEPLSLSHETVLFTSDGESQGTVRELVMQLWKYGVIPEEPGDGSLKPASAPPFFVKSDDRLVAIGIRIETKVWYDWYLGNLPLTVVRGFANELDGSFRAERFATDWLRFDEVERTWQHIETPDNLSVRPIVTFLLKDAPVGDPDAARSMRITVTPAGDDTPPERAG